MKNLDFAVELHLKLGVPASSTVESLRLLRAFLKLAPRQRFEVIKDDGRRMRSFGGPSWTCASIEARISTPHKVNLWAPCAHTENQDLPLPCCMRVPVISRM
ncbi:hypothetical protein ACVIU7_004674 [Bradyrhizobium liaoningense]